MSASLPPIDTSKSDAHHGNQNELQSVGLQKFYDFFKSKATSIPFDSSSAEMPGTIGKSIDIRVGPNFELHPLLETAMPLEKPKLGKFDLEIWQKALDFGKQKYDAFELSEKEKGVVALVIRQKRQAELQAKQQALNLAASAATAAAQQPKQFTKEEEEAERKRLKREKKARKAEKREKKRVKRENPNMEGGGGENTKTGDTTTSLGTKTTAGPTGTYSTGTTK